MDGTYKTKRSSQQEAILPSVGLKQNYNEIVYYKRKKMSTEFIILPSVGLKQNYNEIVYYKRKKMSTEFILLLHTFITLTNLLPPYLSFRMFCL
jgi:hypothetical protein